LGNGQILPNPVAPSPHIYCLGGASTLNGELILDGQGDPNALFIFQINGAFASSVNSKVTLRNGATACNVYWQINGEVSLGTGTDFKGTILANGAIHLLGNATLQGRALSTAGEISTAANVVGLSNPNIANPFALPSIMTTYILTETITATGCYKSDSVVVASYPFCECACP
jgi:Ice-binding-like